MKKFNRLKSKVDRFKRRTFSVTYQYDSDGRVSSNSYEYSVNRKLPNKQWIINDLKTKLKCDAVIILSCFEIQRRGEK